MRPGRSYAAVAVVTVVAAAVVVVGAMPALGSVIAWAGGALVLLGAAVGRLRLALVPVAIGVALAALVLTAGRRHLEDWTSAMATFLVFLGIGGGMCFALGALIRRVGWSMRKGETPQ